LKETFRLIKRTIKQSQTNKSNNQTSWVILLNNIMPEIYSKIALKKFIKDTKLPIKNYGRMTVPLMIEGIDEFLDKNRGGKYTAMRKYMDRVKREMAEKEEEIIKNRIKRINIDDRPEYKPQKEVYDIPDGGGLTEKNLPLTLPTRVGGGGGEDEEGMRSRYKKPVKVLYTYPGFEKKSREPKPMAMSRRPPVNRMNLNLRQEAQEAASNVLNLTIENVIQTSNEKAAGEVLNQVIGNLEAKKSVRRRKARLLRATEFWKTSEKYQKFNNIEVSTRLPKDPEVYPFHAVMKKPITFPSNDQLRLTEGNAEVGQIIMFKVKGETVYSVVTKINPSVVSVKDLILKINEKNHIEFHINTQVNIVHKGNLGYTRNIRIVNHNEYNVYK
jgi:hypothetical protein